MFNDILIIDDDHSNLKLLSRFLQKRGYHISTATSAEEGLDLIADQPPDVLLLDLKLPGMDGLKFTSLLRRNEVTKHIIVIAVTSYENAFDEEKAIKAGCNGYIVKPINIFTLSEKLQDYLQN